MQPWNYEADEWVDYSSYFVANSDIVNSNDIDFVIYGPEKGVIIQYDEVSVTQYLDPANMEDLMMGRSDPVDPEEFQCTGPCCELFQNGDAEDGDSTGWDAIYGGAIIYHPFGPFKSTKSFKHLRRASFFGGPGQTLNTKCLIPGEKYKLSGMIKLTNEYNIPYACTTTTWKSAGTCPLASKSLWKRTNDLFFNYLCGCYILTLIVTHSIFYSHQIQNHRWRRRGIPQHQQ